MKVKFEFGGFKLKEHKRIQLPFKSNPTIDDINSYLDLFLLSDGVLELEQREEEGNIPFRLTLYAENQKYLVMFGKSNPEVDDGVEVRTFYDKTRTPGELYLLGDLWDNSIITEDFSLVRKAFNEFYLTGDIDQNIVS
ncbi:DUF6911 family protein [Snodgrassella alvi]|uniref:DUF6911 family protein n=1 Tax=Snodgrassella alvi TaxID=1196083 RepID=UPI000C1E89FA|nr:hypothetical protein [Snodgrassella alvi]PIT15166.1 hypothetical protein BGI33_06590 [Snodgrassella alvi]PIT16678.1 hypothetical protein BGI34_09510 [Snodgrassella alvi]PIT21227.1 hypothetical protein BGI34_01590 [Snodgrassella alvi]